MAGGGGSMSVSNIIITHRVFSSALFFKAQSSLAPNDFIDFVVAPVLFFLSRYGLGPDGSSIQMRKSFRFDL